MVAALAFKANPSHPVDKSKEARKDLADLVGMARCRLCPGVTYDLVTVVADLLMPLGVQALRVRCSRR